MSENLNLDNELTQVCYTIGANVGTNLAMDLTQKGIDNLDIDALVLGIKNGMNNEPLKIDPEKGNALVSTFMQNAETKKREQMDAGNNKFFEENLKKEGVIQLESGMQYEVMVEGDGEKPEATSEVTTHYHGTLLDGTVFDSSVERGQPATFGVSQVIKGWTEALQLMPKGSKWRLYIPHDLAYGDRGAPPKIAPFAALIFEVELLEIN